MPEPTTARVRHLNAVPDEDDPRIANGTAIERHILGTAMESAADLTSMRVLLTAASFADARHGEIWDVICAAADVGDPTNVTAITERLIDTRIISRLPHTAYPFDLWQAALPGQGGWLAARLADRATRRNLAAAHLRLGQAIATPGVELDQIASFAEEVVTTATATVTESERGQHIAELAEQYVRTYLDYEAVAGIASPWPDLNRVLSASGFEYGQVVTFGAPSGVGKSIALTDCARHFAVELQIPTLYFSLEMTHDQMFHRFIAGLTGVPETAVKNRDMSSSQLAKFDHGRERLTASPLWCLSGGHSFTRISNEIRRFEQRHGRIPIVIVDYVQCLSADRKFENRQVEVSNDMKRLKALSLDDNRLVLTAAQINRGPATRTDKRPLLSDLRESAEIENSSDIVILLYRDDHYDKDSPQAGEAEFDVAKQRGGRKEVVTLAAQLHYTRFVSFEPEPAFVGELTACIRCYSPHQAPQGSRCVKCAA